MSTQRYQIKYIAEIIQAELLVSTELWVKESYIQNLLFDSRKLQSPAHSLFFALKGTRDGHIFINDAYQRGIRSFVVDKNRIQYEDYPEANFLIVDDSLKALQLLAASHRAQYHYPVIAIAGSNGKTIVKDWLYQLLSPDYTIVRSPKSFNSQIGVALSLWQMSDDDNLAIIEAGISKPGEMEALQKMINPTIGILTNVKKAHFENFKSKKEKLQEKLKLFRNVDHFIYSPTYLQTGDTNFSSLIPRVAHSTNEGITIKPFSKVANQGLFISTPQSFTWSTDTEIESDLKLISSRTTPHNTQELTAQYHRETIQIEIPFVDAASIENAIICWSCLLSMGIEQSIIEKRMKALIAVKMRLELKNGINNSSIIDDSYSCDISSLMIALDFLQQQNQHKNRTLILSDIPEIGKDKEKVYQQVAELVESKSIQRFIGIGEEISSFAHYFKTNSIFFSSTTEFLKHIEEVEFQNETILIKGARKFCFESISQLLSLKVHETTLEINLNALENNLKSYKSLLQPKTKLMVMVKAFSYGSGSFEIANLLQFNQVDYLAVAYADEGITLRKSGIRLPIVVMSPDLLAMETLIDYKLEPEIFSFDHLRSFISLLENKEMIDYPIHLKIDTGMHRLGFNPADIDQISDILKHSKQVKIVSVFSHLAASGDEEHDDFTRQQIAQLSEFCDQLSTHLGYTFIKHIANTAAISRFPDAEFDMVRLGIGLYGIHSFESQNLALETVITLKTVVSQIKEISEQDTIGYGRKGQLPQGGQIATVKIGYADGYNRRFGNGVGKMLVNGLLVPTVGDICMDMCMLDITNLDINEGDEVIVFGDQPRIEELACAIETIVYEILTGISQRVKRVYFYE